jgi:3-dehydrosphinganine reductase
MSEPRTVLITGAASGIGRALAEWYAPKAARLLLLDREPPARAAAELTVRAGHTDIRVGGADVRDAADLRAAIHLLAGDEPIDRVIHCAGVLAPTRALADVDPSDFQRVIDINLVGSFNLVHGALPHLKAGSHVALTASLGGLIAGYRYVAYSSSKFGVVGLAETIRMELVQQGIITQVICPGEVSTPLIAEELASGDAVQRAVKLTSGKPISAGKAAELIGEGIESGRFLIIPTLQARWLARISRGLPTPLRLAVTDLTVKRASKQG